MNAESPDLSYRQQAAVLFADVAGYTALMQQNEQAALAMLKQYKQIIHEEAPRFAGEVVQYYGDGCLLLFGSAADAARCAQALQQVFRSRSPELPVRIGIHQGEVVRDEAHVYGDCVNVAARIESMAVPGAVLLSGDVQAAIGSEDGLSAAALGAFALRHVSQPVEIFALTGEALTVPALEQLLRKGIAYQIDNTPPEAVSAALQVLVVEDDMIVGAHISMVLAEAGYGVMGLMPTGEAALAQIRTLPPDLILMDVQLKGKLDGVDTAAQIYQEFRIPVIFLTANADPATFSRAKNTFPYAFIQKPFQPAALLRAIELVVQRIQEEPRPPAPAAPQPASQPRPDHLFVRDKDRMVKLRLSDIRYVEAERNYCRIHTRQRQYLLSTPMKTVEGHLDPEQFVRTHRSFIVSLEAIESLDEYYLYLGDQAIPLSKAYKDALLQRLNRM